MQSTMLQSTILQSAMMQFYLKKRQQRQFHQGQHYLQQLPPKKRNQEFKE